MFSLEDSQVQEVQTVKSFSIVNYKVSSDEKYSFLGEVAYYRCYGELSIFDFQTKELYDNFAFYHMGFYRMNADFLCINQQHYIVFQAHPRECSINDVEWCTCIYSIEEKKQLYVYPFSLGLKYIESRNLLIVETNYRRIRTMFYELSVEKQNIEWITENILEKL